MSDAAHIIGLPSPEQDARLVMLPPRFVEKLIVEPNGCWSWIAGKSTDGYGRFYWRGKNRNAHRVAYALLVAAIPDGLQIDHLCRNRACVNPAHLEPVTGQENLLRGNTWQAANAAKTHCPRGHPLSGTNVYLWRNMRKCRTCDRARKRKQP